MMVKQLIAFLQGMPPEAEVTTEGCDCDGDISQVIQEADGVYLVRLGGHWEQEYGRLQSKEMGS